MDQTTRHDIVDAICNPAWHDCLDSLKDSWPQEASDNYWGMALLAPEYVSHETKSITATVVIAKVIVVQTHEPHDLLGKLFCDAKESRLAIVIDNTMPHRIQPSRRGIPQVVIIGPNNKPEYTAYARVAKWADA